MIIKGKSRAGPASLAAHLGNAETNERIQLLQTRGTLSEDLRGALIEMDAYAAGSRCQRSLYHAAISPEPPHRLSPEQRIEAVDALEKELGLTGHARAVVLHEKLGREHLHVVWARVDPRDGRAVADSHNYRRHELVARELERRFDHERVQGAHVERENVARPDRTPSRAELWREERTGITGKQVKAEVTAAFRQADNAEAFKAALEDAGYRLAQGNQRVFVIIDRGGTVHSLARRIDGVTAAGLREYMGSIELSSLPTVEEVDREAVEPGDFPTASRFAGTRTKLQKAYGRGGDYVSQTTAARKDAKQRQDELDQQSGRDSAWDRIEAGEQKRAAGSQTESGAAQPSILETAQDSDGAEISQRMARLRNWIEEREERAAAYEDDPDHRPDAPGRGHARSR